MDVSVLDLVQSEGKAGEERWDMLISAASPFADMLNHTVDASTTFQIKNSFFEVSQSRSVTQSGMHRQTPGIPDPLYLGSIKMIHSKLLMQAVLSRMDNAGNA